MATGFWIAKADATGAIIASSALELSPGPSAVEYPTEPAAKVIETADGRIIKQQYSYDPRKRAWIWQRFRGNMVPYQNLMLVLESLLASRRLAYGAVTPYVFLKDTTTGELTVLSKETGTATAGTANTLTDSSKSWTADQWNGYTVEIVSGTGQGQTRVVADTLTSPSKIQTVLNWSVNPSTDSKYAIYKHVSDWVRVRVLEVSRDPAAGGGDITYETTRMVFYVDDSTTTWNDLG